MDITKETIKINKIICEKKEQIVVQGDMIVPEEYICILWQVFFQHLIL